MAPTHGLPPDSANWDTARMVQCDSTWFEHYRHGQAILLRAQIPPEDQNAEAEARWAELIGWMRGSKPRPSRLRYEVRQTEEAPAGRVVHHRRRRADALSMTASGAAQPKGGLYGARRSPTMRADVTSAPHATNEARADDAANRALDIDEEPSRMARPTVRALATRLFTAPRPVDSHVVPAAPRISAPIPLNCGHSGVKRKRGRADEVDAAAAAPPTKRRAKKYTKHARLDVTSESSKKTCAP